MPEAGGGLQWWEGVCLAGGLGTRTYTACYECSGKHPTTYQVPFPTF